MKIAIIGYKNHSSRLISIINSLGICNKLVVYHPNKAKLLNGFNEKGLYFETVLTDSLDLLLECNCIFITSPTSSHFEYIVKILPKYNGYIFCEKPPCSSSIEAEKLSSLSISDKERVYFNFNYRFTELSKLCKKAIAKKVYGRLISMEFYSSHGMAFQSSYKQNWRNTSSGILENIIGNVGIHYIDLVNYLLDDTKISSVSSLKVSRNSNQMDTALINISSKKCLPISIYLSYSAPFQNTAKLTFSDAIIELSNGRISISSPRETFDSRGFFKPPEKKVLVKFQNSRDYYNQSLVESIQFFINQVNDKKKLISDDFDCSIKTVENILSLQNFQ
jgi:predicted dehydrogenase